MGYDIGYIFGSILGGIFPIAFVVGILFFAFKMQKRLFKALFDKFQTEESIPTEAIRTGTFQYGNNAKVQNTVKMAERQDALFLKFPMNKALKIPFTAIRRVKLKTGMFKSKIITLNFSDESLNPVHMTIKAVYLAKFPQLLKGVEGKESEGETAAKYTETFTPNLDLAKIKDEIKASNPALPSTASNLLRSLAMIVILIVGVAVLIAYYA